MLKLGIIGTNFITDRMLKAAEASGEYQLTSVYSRHLSRAKDFGEKYGATEFYDSLEDFFDQGDFSVVYIASPNSLHYPQARLAIENDKDVIVEKPAFVNPHEYHEIDKLLANHPQARLVEGARHIHTPLFKAMAKQVAQMKQVQGATFTMMQYSSRYDKVLENADPMPNIFTLEYAGGALQDLGVYCVYDAVTLFGMPDSSVYYPTLVETGVDGKGVAVLQYHDFTVVLNFSKTTNTYIGSEIHGLRDTMWLDNATDFHQATYFDEEKKAHELKAEVHQNPLYDEMVDFAQLFNHKDDPAEIKQYDRWHKISRNVNQLMYDLRQSADLVFPSDENY
ncbi:Gfo/Idh/MocA family protein [Limosilactobacillus sp.]|uniref:Gfo/Idh/MocA family protein n=1 Tax=Limosilactobacillus sp. TaxID=2773925 RepID=UPI00345E3B3E